MTYQPKKGDIVTYSGLTRRVVYDEDEDGLHPPMAARKARRWDVQQRPHQPRHPRRPYEREDCQMKQRLLLISKKYSIEPLGLMHLAGVANAAGWDCRILLLDATHSELPAVLDGYKPDLVGIQVWTGGHKEMFEVADGLRACDYPVVIGGPHATYFAEDCAKHADWVVRGHGYQLLRRLLLHAIPHGVLFDEEWSKDPIPLPSRSALYRRYPEFAASTIKSMIASVGCPYTCTYCYAPVLNEMYGGFRLVMRDVDDVVREGQEIRGKWPAKLIFWQDDVFGFDVKWLREFAPRWKQDVGLEFHCQIRIELTQGDVGSERLDLLKAAGCTGITLAIESGNEFLRDHVLFRHMPTPAIKDGCAKIMSRGMTLRTEQILAVPFSDLRTDLETLQLNADIKPTMAWTSILAPYGGTNLGTISSRFGFYSGTNDDLSASFFDRSTLRHVEGGPTDIKRLVDDMAQGPRSHVLLKLRAGPDGAVIYGDLGKIGSIRWLSDKDNERYADQTARLQALFLWLARMPDPVPLARWLLAIPEWSWSAASVLVQEHTHTADSMLDWYFGRFVAGDVLLRACVEAKIWSLPAEEALAQLGSLTRRHVYEYELYRTSTGG